AGPIELREAQLRKIDRLLDLAQVREGTRVLELGTGWGELAVRAGGRNAHVRTVTLSEQQAQYAANKVRDAGLAQAVDVEMADYRSIGCGNGAYDAVICVEMLEGIGEENWADFFSLLNRVLTPTGRIALHVITVKSERFEVSKRRHNWITKYIFPGWQLPSIPALHTLAREHTSLSVLDIMSFGPHYAETLRIWRETFQRNERGIRELGFDSVFVRTWLFYLASCEAAFRAGHFDVHHILLGRTGE
ncbi:cyclopropane-fatty-acyl-phospholipid synthase family protein, partial [Micromonospora sp. NPDC049580]|uniref:cyclopropane-fatty-acyl-phospholipid synthase family protein n=1 Tax=Micromonospora sp. NPDC049580 TaxID=3154832 RepID=UPI003431C10D